MLKTYSTFEEFLTTAKGVGNGYREYDASEFFGYKTFPEALDLATSGDSSLVANAEALLDKLADVTGGDAVQDWTASPCGAYPVVPEFLAGHPACMRLKRDTEDVSPVNVFVATTISGALEPSDILKRGTAILALVLKLQAVRPVQLWVTAETHGKTDGSYIQIIPLQSNPISIAHTCNALTSAHFARHLTYAVARAKDGFNGKWSDKFVELGGNRGDKNGRYEKWFRSYVGLQPQDLYIMPGHIHDDLIQKPVEWVNAQLAKFNGLEVE